jgi:hypothetical protein
MTHAYEFFARTLGITTPDAKPDAKTGGTP